ncbi:hypothetical protein EMQ25_05020 [Arsenicitalea aurantiaca]|uniref:Transglycosylase SLT domain-containing protein n=1 Tax=Arsenicitalea aurantiaca TaxID=1783274 RepID=A0A433XEI6_9HYPH|nr:transglycosylase SLT domain-containing protein [Arsenicitalea aurantiaca]RUT32519.1 hypothetical protein EMQ25_05020 [Arsenicitalea aurantiaca]
MFPMNRKPGTIATGVMAAALTLTAGGVLMLFVGQNGERPVTATAVIEPAAPAVTGTDLGPVQAKPERSAALPDPDPIVPSADHLVSGVYPPEAEVRVTTAAIDFATDPIVTGSLGYAAQPARVDAALEAIDRATAPAKGSERFAEALELLDDGKHAEAFAFAQRLTDPAERRTVQWAAIQYGAGAIDYREVLAFRDGAPEFTSTSFRTRIEQAMTRGRADHDALIAELGDGFPNTLEAQIALARAFEARGDEARAREIARTIWTENTLDQAGERRVLGALGGLLTADDHWDRAVFLMALDRAQGAERLAEHFTAEQKALMEARNAVSRKEKNARQLLDALDARWHDHPLYILSRAQRALQANLTDQAITWFGRVEGERPAATEWGFAQRDLARRLLNAGDAERAYKAIANFDSGPAGRVVESQFLAGWLALNYLKDPEAAARHFAIQDEYATLPDSITQANYWLGRARQQLGDADGADAAFAKAAHFHTVYYGQLARSELGLPAVQLREIPDLRASQLAFDGRDVVRGVRLLAENGHRTWATTLLRGFADGLEDGPQLALAAELAQTLGAANLAIAIADGAERKGVPLDDFSFPEAGIPANVKLASVDKAAVYAVTKQESLFQVDAVSHAGARGLMQLMPGTARETAERVGLPYSQSRLTSDPAYNALLGSTYLKAQLDRYQGSLVLAAAAYNAGAGNANRWIRAYGDPRTSGVDPVVWVELIPFQETRKYVQRVLGNYLVYRARLGSEPIDIKQALRRIPHA